MKTFVQISLVCDSCYVTVDWDTATPILESWIHIS